MISVKIGNATYPAKVDGKVADHEWGGRASKSITLEMPHADAEKIFVDNAAWSIVHQPNPYVGENGETVTPEAVEYDNSDYCIAGAITDHRDGTLTVKMGKLTELEETLYMVYGGAE